MKAVFINDHPFYLQKTDNVVYTSGTLDSDFWRRYKNFFDTVFVVGRGIEVDKAPGGLSVASSNAVVFELFFDVNGGLDYFLKRRRIVEKLQDVIHDADLVIIRVPSSIGNLAATLCQQYKKKYIVEVVGCILDVSKFYGNPIVKLLAPFFYRKMQRVVRNAEGAIYVTEKFLQKRYPTRKQSISASNVKIKCKDDSILTRRLQNIETGSSPLKIGVIGGLNTIYKGHHILLKAASKLMGLNYDFRIYFVGGGDGTRIKSLISELGLENIVFNVGKLKKGAAVLDFLDNIDLYVHPSLTEGLPRSVIEAMSRGCPALVSNAGGLPELISSEYVHNAGDSEKLFSDIKKLGFCKELLSLEAKKNFIKSKEFDEDYLEQKRNKFINKIVNNL